MAKILSLGTHTDEVAEKVLEAGAVVLENKARENLKSVIGKGTKEKSRSTGELLASLGTTKPGLDRSGNINVKVGFNSYRNDGRNNNIIANTIENGKSGQPAKPFMKPAYSSTKNDVVRVMSEKLDEEMAKL